MQPSKEGKNTRFKRGANCEDAPFYQDLVVLPKQGPNLKIYLDKIGITNTEPSSEQEWFELFCSELCRAGAEVSARNSFLVLPSAAFYAKVVFHFGKSTKKQQTEFGRRKVEIHEAVKQIRYHFVRNQTPIVLLIKQRRIPVRVKSYSAKRVWKKVDYFSHCWPVYIESTGTERNRKTVFYVKDCNDNPVCPSGVKKMAKLLNGSVMTLGPTLKEDMTPGNDTCVFFTYKFIAEVMEGKFAEAKRDALLNSTPK